MQTRLATTAIDEFSLSLSYGAVLK